MSYKFTTREIVQKHVQMFIILQTLMDTATKVRVLKLFQDISFVNYVLYLLFAGNLSLFQTFKRKILPSLLITNQFDGSKATSTQYLQYFEVIEAVLLTFGYYCCWVFYLMGCLLGLPVSIL